MREFDNLTATDGAFRVLPILSPLNKQTRLAEQLSIFNSSLCDFIGLSYDGVAIPFNPL